MRNLFLLAALLAAAVVGVGHQIVPGQLPAGPPPAPGQLGSQPAKPAKTAPATGAPQTGPVAPAPDPDAPGDENTIRIGVKYILVPTVVLDPDGHNIEAVFHGK